MKSGIDKQATTRLSPNGMVSTKTGWLIINSMGRRWDGYLYDTKEAAELTARCCVGGPFTVVEAKRVQWIEWEGHKQYPRQQIIINGEIGS